MAKPASYDSNHSRNGNLEMPEPGTQVRLTNEVDRFPECIVPAGSTGEVVEEDGEHVSIRLDHVQRGLEEWGNCVMWTADDYDSLDAMLKDFWESVEVVEPSHIPN